MTEQSAVGRSLPSGYRRLPQQHKCQLGLAVSARHLTRAARVNQKVSHFYFPFFVLPSNFGQKLVCLAIQIVQQHRDGGANNFVYINRIYNRADNSYELWFSHRSTSPFNYSYGKIQRLTQFTRENPKISFPTDFEVFTFAVQL